MSGQTGMLREDFFLQIKKLTHYTFLTLHNLS
jgi:hypothetical protein